MSTNDEKIRETLSKEPVPRELEPENIRIMLDEKAPVKKRKNIKKTATRITAGAAACAVICGTSVYFAGQRDSFNKGKNASDVETTTDKKLPELPVLNLGDDDDLTVNVQASYMSGASGYEEVYQLYKKAEEKYSENHKFTNYRDMVDKEVYFESAVDTAVGAGGTVTNGESDGMTQGEFSDAETKNEIVTVPAGAADDMRGEAPETAPEMPESPPVEIAPEEPATEIAPEEPMEEPPVTEDIPEATVEPEAEPETEPEEDEDAPDHSETHNQEEGVLEADIVKTDGEYIYYLYNADGGALSYGLGLSSYYNGTSAKLNIAAVDDGEFTSAEAIDIEVTSDYAFGEGYTEKSLYVNDMYLYNDMLLVVGTVSGSKEEVIEDRNTVFDTLIGDRIKTPESTYFSTKSAVFVSVYTTGESPELIDTYYQEGAYDDVRIAPDGYMYLVSDYTTQQFSHIDDEEQLDSYVPKCGVSKSASFLAPDDILMPEEELEEATSFSCTVIGSIDLNTSGEITTVDSKALAGYTGEIYSSAGNLYTTIGWDDTEITRIAIGGGSITPAANGKVEGRIKDQFSMSEYGGYFRIATTKDSYEDKEQEYTWYDENGEAHTESYVSHIRTKRDNRVYVLDMDMNIVGSLTDFGVDEEIKSVNFSGNTAYVVTYEQTDPLFAIDLSDPATPTIMDEFKILGYSTYMQQWTEGNLLGFGVAADEDGIEQGIKLTMFDNSDPYNLDALDTYEILQDDDSWINSVAVWERKALLIAPEKNLIGVPIMKETWAYDYEYLEYESGYAFFNFVDGEFVYRGTIDSEIEEYSENDIFCRSVYVGDYAYILCGSKFIAVDIQTMEITDEVNF